MSSIPVAMLTNNFLAGVSKWVTTAETRTAATDPMAKCISLRYDEFTSKDPVAKAKVVRATLVHLGALDAKLDDTALAPALAVFNTHSQTGTAMAGPKAKVVLPRDVPLIQQAAAAYLAPLERKGSLLVQDGGANFALKNSLGL